MEEFWRWSESSLHLDDQHRLKKKDQKEIKSPTVKRRYLTKISLRGHEGSGLNKTSHLDCRPPGWTWLFRAARTIVKTDVPPFSVEGNSGPNFSLGSVSQNELKYRQRSSGKRREDSQIRSCSYLLGTSDIGPRIKGSIGGWINGLCFLNLDMTCD